MFLSTGRPPLSFALNGIAVCERGGESVEKVWHYVLAPLATILEYESQLEVARWRGASTANLERKGGTRIPY